MKITVIVEQQATYWPMGRFRAVPAQARSKMRVVPHSPSCWDPRHVTALVFVSCRHGLKYFGSCRALGRAKQSYRGPSKNARASPSSIPGTGRPGLSSTWLVASFTGLSRLGHVGMPSMEWKPPFFFLLWKNPKQKHQQGASLDKGKGNASFHDRWFYLVSSYFEGICKEKKWTKKWAKAKRTIKQLSEKARKEKL